MKKLNTFLLSIFLFMPGFLLAQNNVTVVPSGPVQENNVIDPDKVAYFFVLGFILVFILFVVIGLSRATATISKTLGDKYKSEI